MKKPNLLFLMADHLRAEVLRPDSLCPAPCMRELVASGVRFDRAYTTNAICSPARAGLMTGLLPHNHGVLTVTHCVDNDQACLRTRHPHWAQRLQAAGYRTGYFGKWHIERAGDKGESLAPFGWEVSNTDCAHGERQPVWERELRLQTPGYADQRFCGIYDLTPEERPMGRIAARAGEYLAGILNQSDPWCCMVSVPEPHDPYYCSRSTFDSLPPELSALPANAQDAMADKPGVYRKAAGIFAGFREEEVRFARACYYGCVHEIDSCFGTLVEQVRRAGKLEDTIIVLTTDHGDCLGAHGLFCKNIGAFEEVYNVPLVLAGPGLARGEVSSARVGTHELCPTLLELAGAEPIRHADSRSFAVECRQPGSAAAEFSCGYAEFFGTRMPLGQRVVYKDRWKFVHNAFDYDELYDLAADPGELRNLAKLPEFSPIVADLCRLMWDYVRKTGDHTLLHTNYPPLRLAPLGPEA